MDPKSRKWTIDASDEASIHGINRALDKAARKNIDYELCLLKGGKGYDVPKATDFFRNCCNVVGLGINAHGTEEMVNPFENMIFEEYFYGLVSENYKNRRFIEDN